MISSQLMKISHSKEISNHIVTTKSNTNDPNCRDVSKSKDSGSLHRLYTLTHKGTVVYLATTGSDLHWMIHYLAKDVRSDRSIIIVTTPSGYSFSQLRDKYSTSKQIRLNSQKLHQSQQNTCREYEVWTMLMFMRKDRTHILKYVNRKII